MSSEWIGPSERARKSAFASRSPRSSSPASPGEGSLPCLSALVSSLATTVTTHISLVHLLAPRQSLLLLSPLAGRALEPLVLLSRSRGAEERGGARVSLQAARARQSECRVTSVRMRGNRPPTTSRGERGQLGGGRRGRGKDRGRGTGSVAGARGYLTVHRCCRTRRSRQREPSRLRRREGKRPRRGRRDLRPTSRWQRGLRQSRCPTQSTTPRTSST